MGEELFEFGADLVMGACKGGGLPSQPSGVLRSDQSPLVVVLFLLLLATAVPFLVCLRKPKLILGIRLPKPPPAALALLESVMLPQLVLLVWRERGAGRNEVLLGWRDPEGRSR